MPIKSQVFPDDVWISVEPAAPKTVANKDRIRAVEDLLLRRKFPARRGHHAPDLKKARRNPSTSHFLRQRAGGFGDVLGVVAGERLKRGIETIPVLETGWSNKVERPRIFRIVLVDAHQLSGLWER